MKKIIIVIAIATLIYSCSSKSTANTTVKSNRDTELVKNIESYINNIESNLPLTDESQIDTEYDKTEKIFIEIAEKEAFYKGKKVVKILATQHLVDNYREAKEFYYNNDELVCIKIKQFVFLKNQPKKQYLRELYFSKGQMISDFGHDSYETPSFELFRTATIELNEEYNKI